MRAHRQRIFSRITIATTIYFAGALATAQTSNTFNDAINRGVAAFKAENYEDAVEAFRHAQLLNPKSTTAILDLGTAYAYQDISDGDPTRNLMMANKAIDIFKGVPTDDPGKWVALRQTASVYRKTKRLDEARDTEREALKLRPSDADGHYIVGLIDWLQSYLFAVEALTHEGLKDNGFGNKRMSSAACAKIKTHNTALIADSIAELTRVVELEPKNADAMEYLNVVYRRKADVDCTNPSARIQDIAIASQWSSRAAKAKFPLKTLWQNPIPEPPSPIVQ